MVLMVSYDLNGRERPSSYEAVKAYLEEHSVSWARPLYSQWFIETKHSPDAWLKALRDSGLIDSDDRLFICQVRQPYEGWLTEEVWKWLNARI